MKSIYFKAYDKMMIKVKKIIEKDSTIMLGRIVTGEAFIDQEGRDKIIEKYQPLCVDMETASMAHVCYVNSISFLAVRSMSDTAKESGNDVFEKYYKVAAEKSVKVVQRYLDSI